MTHNVLVVEDNAITRKMMRVALESAGYGVMEAGDGKTALRLAREKSPALILQDLVLPDMDGLDLVRELRRALQNPQVPIVACTGLLPKPEDARRIQGGFTDFILKPVAPSRLLELIDKYLGVPGTGLPKDKKNIKVLLVNDDPVGLKVEKLVLEREGFAVTTATDGKEAWEKARKSRPDAVLSDLIMPRMSGFDLCVALRKSSKFARLPIVIATATGSQENAEKQRLAKKVGADAFVARTADLKEAISALEAALRRRTHPKPAADSKMLKDAYLERVFKQLEQQTSRNAEAMRCAAEERAQLSVVASITETLNRKLPLKAVLDEALARILDAAGISIGGVYLADSDGKLVLQSQIGYIESKELEGFFGHSDLLYRALIEVKALKLPSPEIPEHVTRDLQRKIAARSLLIAPLIVADDALGVLVLFSSRRELTDDWVNSVKSVAVQLAQAVLLARTVAQVTESEQRFRELAENIREIFFVSGPTGAPIYYVSQAYEEITGRSRESLHRDPRSWLEAIHPDDRQRIENAYSNYPGTLDEEYRIERPDGTLRWLRSRAFQVRNESGAVIRIVGIADDVTERKHAEEETRRNLERIRALHEIDLAITSTLDLQTVLDVLLEKVEVFLPIAAASTVRLVDSATGDLEPLACRGIDRAAWLARQEKSTNRRGKRVVETREPQWVRDVTQDPESVGAEFYREQGILSYLEVPLIAHDRALGVLGIYTREAHDFEREEIEFLNTLAGQAAIAIHNAQLFEQINRQARDLEKANSVKDEFLGVMSHELRTPLNITMGYVEMMKDGMLGEVTQEQKTALQKVLNQCADQLRMVNDILVTTHLESRVTIVDLERVDLSDVFNSLKSDFKAIHDSDEPELVWDYPGEPLPVITDRRKLRQIVQNLVSNALKFTERGRIAVSLKVVPEAPDRLPVSTEKGGDQGGRARLLEIKVSDTGVGIPPEKLDAIFDKFHQVDSSATRVYGGLGLGLYIVKQFTEFLGGEITVESAPGKGSTFTVTIPVGS